MPNPVRLLPLSLIALSPGLAWAEDLTFTGSITATSNYLDDGISKTDGGPALQPFLEVSKNGFYADLWASNIKDDTGATGEVDATLGYRNNFNPMVAYDLNYTQHFYNKGVGSTGEVDALLEVTPFEKLTLGTEGTYDTDGSVFGVKFAADYAITDPLSISALYGFSEGFTDQFWEIGASYDITDKASFNVMYGDTPDTSGAVSVSLTYNFDFLRH